MDLALWQEANIANSSEMFLINLAQRFECGAMRRRSREIVHLVAILTEIVKFFRRLGLPKMTLGRIQFPFVEKSLPHLCRRCLEHGGDMLAIDAMGHVVSDIDVATVGEGPHEVVALVHSAPKTKVVAALGGSMFAKEGSALHVSGGLDASQTEYGWGEVDE